MEEKTREASLDSSLRPKTFGEYIGQDAIKNHLSVLLGAARERGNTPEHLLFHGPPGVGKTTISYLIANEMGAQIKTVSGALLDRSGDLVSLVTSLEAGDVLFIDEIHRLNKSIEEVLYPIMESGCIDIIIGKGVGAKSMKINLPPTTFIAATTMIGDLSAPLRSRFSGGVLRIDYYSQEEVESILTHSAETLNVELTNEAKTALAQRSRGIPRTANYLLKRARDIAQIQKTPITLAVAEKAFAMLEIDNKGLTKEDRRLLEVIKSQFKGGPVGVDTLAMILNEPAHTIEEVYESFLLRLGFLERTPRGRKITEEGKAHLKDAVI